MAVDETLLERSLSLPASERAELAEHLLLSLEEEAHDPRVEQLWIEEIRRRREDLHSGRVTPVAWRDAVERVRGKLGRNGSA